MLSRIVNFAARWTLVQRFRFISFIVMILGTLFIGRWVADRIKTSVINQSAATTALYLDSFVTPNLQVLAQLDTLSPENVDTLNNLLTETNMGRHVVTVKVWDPNGRIIYSNRSSLIGRVFPGTDINTAWAGNVFADISQLEDAENFEERRLYKTLLEIYIPVRQNGTHKIIAVAEFYQEVNALEAEITTAQRQSWLAVGLSMAVIYLLLIEFFRMAYNRIERQEVALNNQVAQLTEVLSQNDELDQRVRRASANTATLNERILRRITSDLTGGPLHEINLALSQLEHAMGESKVCRLININSKCSDNLPIIQTSVQTALNEILAITNGLGLPHLDNMSLREIFANAVHTHELRTETKVNLNMNELPDQASLPIKIAAYRIVQEALNNAQRHASGAGQQVSVIFKMDQLNIEVSDRGPGFNVRTPMKEGHLGLAGMRERVESLGGQFSVESKINEGTKIIARLFLHGTEAIAHGS